MWGGVLPLYLLIYKVMCGVVYYSPKAEHVFPRSFLTMEWYLMDSADNCVLSHVNHLEWRDDCLIIYVSLIKTNKKGVGQITPWHVHYNSNSSEIFPVNSLVMYLFNIYRSLWGIGYCLLVWTSIKDTLRL